jgi:hypothetical protein
MVGFKQIDDRLWLFSFMDCDAGCFDDTQCRLGPIDNPFGARLLPMSPEQSVIHVSGRARSMQFFCRTGLAVAMAFTGFCSDMAVIAVPHVAADPGSAVKRPAGE